MTETDAAATDDSSYTSLADVAESQESTSGTSTPTATPTDMLSKKPSPLSSREHSPARPRMRHTNSHSNNTSNSTGSSGVLPRSGRLSRNNSTDGSPNRGPSLAGSGTTIPSAASIQRALSSTNIPSLPPAAPQDSSQRVPRSSTKTPSNPNSGETTPHWPISPRFKSPPPANEARSRSTTNTLRTPQQQKKQETFSTPSIVVQSSSPIPPSRIPVKDDSANSETDEQPPTMKPSVRSVSGVAPKLETVQESSSQPTTPSLDEDEAGSLSSTPTGPKASDEPRNDLTSSKITEDLSARLSRQVESGKMQEMRSISTHRPLSNKPSLASLHAMRSRNEPPLRNMTVETETVPSVAQTTIGSSDRSASGRIDGSLRLKPSNETIRPKKERKTAKRKAPSINSSSKADVFEQKVANAVDEADSSDSDATFIYESNPHDQPHRSRQHHSRTPSMTSLVSAHERLALRETHKNPNKKSSMKFGNPYTHSNGDADGDRDGTMRIGSGRMSAHHHIRQHGHGRGTLSHIMSDSDSSFMPQSSRARGVSSRQPSQPNSPRFPDFIVGNGTLGTNSAIKNGEYSTYDIDTEHAADDERTPLVPSRSPRGRPTRHRNSVTIRQRDHGHHRNSGGCFRRFAGCLVLIVLLLVVVFSAVGLVFATTKPLAQLEVREIRNAIASPDEIILDLAVDAINPNIIGVTVADMDVIIFAKSKHVGSDKWWRDHGRHNEEHWLPIEIGADDVVAHGGVDHGTDPIDDPEIGGPHIMSLGRIFHFDAPLNFDGTFFKHRLVQSTGEIRLLKPGNKTEAGGSERWEEVLQYPFELIVRGSFKYQLPLSTTERKVPVTATYFYDPDAEKRRLKALEEETELKKGIFSILVSPPSSPTPLGRFDRRATPLLDWHVR